MKNYERPIFLWHKAPNQFKFSNCINDFPLIFVLRPMVFFSNALYMDFPAFLCIFNVSCGLLLFIILAQSNAYIISPFVYVYERTWYTCSNSNLTKIFICIHFKTNAVKPSEYVGFFFGQELTAIWYCWLMCCENSFLNSKNYNIKVYFLRILITKWKCVNIIAVNYKKYYSSRHTMLLPQTSVQMYLILGPFHSAWWKSEKETRRGES